MACNDRNSSRSKPADASSDTTPSPPNDNLELSTVDKTWGTLFDGTSPTERFGQLNRGIANRVVSQALFTYWVRFQMSSRCYDLSYLSQDPVELPVFFLKEESNLC
jgi:hypothetical protein